MKKIPLVIIVLFTFYLGACKKKDKQPQTTMEKIQGKWTLDTETDNEHSGGQDNITSFNGTANDIIEFRNDGNAYSDVFGTKDTSAYTLQSDTKIILDGNQTFDIKTLTSNSFIIYYKDIFSADEYEELTISLKR